MGRPGLLPAVPPVRAGGRRDRLYGDAALERQPREKLLALREERLRRQLERLVSRSPFHRRQLEEAGAEPGDMESPVDLARLPVTTKEELREEQVRRPPFGDFVARRACVGDRDEPAAGRHLGGDRDRRGDRVREARWPG